MRLQMISGWAFVTVSAVGCSFPAVDLGALPAGGSSSSPATSSATSVGLGGGSSVGAGSSGSSTTHTVKEVAAGWYHTCALLTDGTVWCWGNNYGGMLGDGTQLDHLQPAPVLGLSGTPTHIAAGYTASCALYGDGNAQCWGSNSYGQLGDGTTTDSSLPTQLLLSGATQISTGEYHTCALADGSVDCWGNERYSVPASEEHVPKGVPIDGARAVSAGAALSCALLSNQQVTCWGLSDATEPCTPQSATSPTTVVGVELATQVSVGGDHACALLGDGTVSCWGSNTDGQLGESASAPVCDPGALRGAAPVDGVSDVVQVSCGDSHTCALLASGKVACWGLNTQGQLGDGTPVAHANPSLVVGINNAVQISAGFAQTCAVLDDGSLTCWGNLFQLGDFSHPPPQPLPQTVHF